MIGVSEEAAAAIKRGSKSFALAARFLPRAQRRDAVELYQWCRFGDDLVDGQTDGYHAAGGARATDAHARLQSLIERTEAAMAGRPDDHPAFQGLSRLLRETTIRPEEPRALLEGFSMDVDARQYETRADLLDYAYHVAGVVGVMMAKIMGVDRERTLDRASDLGIAFQLTNVARDIHDDARAGRVYLPRDMLDAARAPTRAAAMLDPTADQQVYAAALSLLDLADDYYASAAEGVRELDGGARRAIAMAARVYREIGEKIRKGGPGALRQRAFTRKREKARLAALAYFAPYPKIEAPRSPSLYTRPRA